MRAFIFLRDLRARGDSERNPLFMKRVKIGDLRPGMITAEDVYNYNDQLVFPKGHKLDQSSIDRLDMFSIMSIRVEDQKEATFSPEPEQDRIKPEHYVEMPYSEHPISMSRAY